MTFPNAAGIGQLSQNGQNIWPLTVPDAIKTPAYMGGNLGTALNQLSGAVLYNQKQIAKYAEVNINLSNVSVGDEVNLPYNGVMVPHIVVQIGNPDAEMYDASCDGVWLLRKDCVAQGQWNISNVNTLEGSTIMTTMQGYVANYDSAVQAAIKTVKIPYCVGNGSTTVNTLTNGLQCQVFPLSTVEMGQTDPGDWQIVLSDGVKLDYFETGISTLANNIRISFLGGNATTYFARNTSSISTTYVAGVSSSGTFSSLPVQTNSYSYRPCFIMPTTFTATYLVDEVGNVETEQEYISAGSYEDILGNTIPVSKIETGTYVGTGTYGSDNPSTITFQFSPKLIFIVQTTVDAVGYVPSGTTSKYALFSDYFQVFFAGCSRLTAGSVSGSSSGTVTYSISGNELTRYGGTAETQMNDSNTNYIYVAIG